jgi:lysophospholipase L1-like esterase
MCFITLCCVSFVLSYGQSEPQWKTLYSTQAKSAVYVIGDINSVLTGTVKRSQFQQQVPADILFSAGGGTFSEPEGTGEMLTLAGTSFVKSLDAAKGYKTESSTAILKSPFSFGLLRGSAAKEILRMQSAEGVSMEQVLRALSARYGRVFAVFGIGKFSFLTTTAIKRAPIYGEPISAPEHRANYFHPVDSLNNQSGIFFGIVINTEKPQPPGYADSLERKAVYINYADNNPVGTGQLQSHTHVLISTDARALPSATTPDEVLRGAQSYPVNDIRHLLTQSVLTDGLLMVYDVGAIVPYSKYGAYWYHKASQFEDLAKHAKSNPIVMLGNSITDGFMTNEYLSEYNILNRGISGDITQGLLDRLESSVIALKPSMLFVMIGTNDIARGYSDSLILANYDIMLQEVAAKSPQTKVVIESILPTRNNLQRPNGRIDTLNQKLKELAKRHQAEYLNLHPLFKDKDGNLGVDYSIDGLHLNAAAYTIWAKELKAVIAKQKR